MKPLIRSADAPGYEVVTLTTVFDSFGYCRIGNTVAARRPINRISRLTTTDRTGRLMKISVKAIADYPGPSGTGHAPVRKTRARYLFARPGPFGARSFSGNALVARRIR